MSETVHYADEGRGGFVPLCGDAVEGDGMWWFIDEQITCDACRARARLVNVYREQP